MTDRIQGGDAYENAILRPERGREVAPRITAGYAELVALLADGEEHSRDDCYMVMEESGEKGLATATAGMLLERALYFGQIVGRFGYERRVGASGVARNVRLYVAYRLTPEGLRSVPAHTGELSISAVTRDPGSSPQTAERASVNRSKRARSSSRLNSSENPRDP